jgi:hypothetical protein
MMPLVDSIVYMATLLLSGFMGCLFIHIIDKKTDEMPAKNLSKKANKVRNSLAKQSL